MGPSEREDHRPRDAEHHQGGYNPEIDGADNISGAPAVDDPGDRIRNLLENLLAKCCSETLDYYPFDSRKRGRFYAGIDLAERVDHSVIAVLERTEILRLVHMHRFKKGTSIASVIGYAKLLSERWDRIHATYVDSTKHGDYIIENMREAGVANPKGVFFTAMSKQEMTQILRQRMTQGQLQIPYDRDLLDELNTENYQLTKTGRITYSHPEGTHDDRFWALALAAYAAEQTLPPPSRPIARGRGAQ